MKFAFAVVAVIAALAQSSQQVGFVSYGPRSVSCGTWNTTAKGNREEWDWWVMGFVSGAGRELSIRNLQLKETDPDGLMEWISKYCADHPLDNLVRASVLLVDELKK
jgi:hypothetical protein